MNRVAVFLEASQRARGPTPPARAAAPAPVVAAPKSRAAAFIEGNARHGNPHAFADVDRIVNIPYVPEFPVADREALSRRMVLAEHYERGFRLMDKQADAVLAFLRHGFAFCDIGVGHGKTLATLLISGIAFARGIRATLLCIPSQIVSQLKKRDLAWARARVVLHGLQVHFLDGPSTARRLLAKSKRPGCYVMPYSIMSAKDASEIIGSIAPQLIIFDEAQNLRNYKAARTKRMFHYLKDHSAGVVALSGTMTSKSVMDYHHLISQLGEASPLPKSRGLAQDWGTVIDSDAEFHSANTGPLLPLIRWAQEKDPDHDYPQTGAGFRRAYRLRLMSCPAVVSTGDAVVGASLTIENRTVDVSPYRATAEYGRLQDLKRKVVQEWLTPDGDEIDHAMHVFRWSYELSAGGFNSLVWPDVERVMRLKNCSLGEAQDLLARALDHHAALQIYHKALRTWLQEHYIAGLDTPQLVGLELSRNGGKNIRDTELLEAYQYERSLRDPRLPERDSRYVRVSSFKLDEAVKWALEAQEGILWFYHNGVGAWLADLLPEALFCPAGKEANEAIAESKGRLVIASMTAHGTGKNLQFHRNQLFVQWPRSALTAEQTIGRLHRIGQEADELLVHTLIQPEDSAAPGVPSFDELTLAATLNDALYVHQTTGSPQKVIYCNWNPLPLVVPTEVLIERGLEPKKLTREQQAMLREKFTFSS